VSEHDVLQRQRRRELRGSMLRTARTVYAEQGAGVTLGNFLFVAGRNRWTHTQIAEEAAYLAECGYLARMERKRDALDVEPPVDYRLTVKGVQLLNGDIEDPSIEL
jgi:hypothetical protein